MLSAINIEYMKYKSNGIWFDDFAFDYIFKYKPKIYGKQDEVCREHPIRAYFSLRIKYLKSRMKSKNN